MKKGGIILLVLGMLAIIVVIIAIEFIGNKPGKREANPYAYKVGTLADVDPSWIKWEEIRQIAIQRDSLSALEVSGDQIFISGKGFFMEMDPDGRQKSFFTFEGKPTAMTVGKNVVYLAFSDHIEVFAINGQKLAEWKQYSERSYITCLQIRDEIIFVADAGKREVLEYGPDGELLLSFTGKNSNETAQGFFIPSPYFDLDINNDGELWVANTGMHALENYDFNGELRGFWTNPSNELRGFTGCCNPAHFTIMDDGTFVTSEKGLVRIKTYKPSGELLSVVSDPALFSGTYTAPDVAVSTSGLIYALDFSQNTVRVFRKK